MMGRKNFLFNFFKLQSDTTISAFDFTKIKRYFENNVTRHSYQVLTEQTCTDLDFDAFFFHVNKTSSCVGQQYLYDRLRRIPYKSEMEECDEVIRFLKDNKERTARYRKIISGLAHDDAYYICSLFHDCHPVQSPMVIFIIRMLQIMPLLFTAVFFVYSKGIWLLLIAVLIITNIVFHYRNKQIQFIYMYSIPQFLKLVSVAKKISVETPFNKTYPDIERHLVSLKPLVRCLSRFKFDVKLENDAVALLWSLKEMVSIFFLSEPNGLFRSFRLIEAKRADIEAVFTYVGQADMLISVAHLQENLPCYCKPKWTDAGLSMTDVYHPLIEQCIPNTLDTFGKSVLLTGSNMSGKTTFIRTLALNMLSAQTLDMCFAESFSGRRMRIHTAISLHDNLLESQSYYMKEVHAVKEMLAELYIKYNLEPAGGCGLNVCIDRDIWKQVVCF